MRKSFCRAFFKKRVLAYFLPVISVEFLRLLTHSRRWHHRLMTTNIVFTQAAFRRGVWRSLPLVAGLSPFGFVTGLITERHALTLLECVLMNGLVYAGASQLVALANWTHPAPILAAAFAALVVNMRFALMGPVLAPWLAGLTPVRRYAALSILVDHAWAISVTDMRKGGRDVALFVGLSIPLWFGWLFSTTAGYLCASALDLPPHHPLFFGALAAFVALLVPLWRGRSDLLPWAVAGGTAVLLAQILPHTSWYIVGGALTGCAAGAWQDSRHG
jgi:predicted branched-subunit amino acid permease